MDFKITESPKHLSLDVDAIAALISRTQYDSGEIPWFRGDKTDPWDHVESIMGLTIGGDIPSARKGFDWLVENQLDNGCWYAAYRHGAPDDKTLDTNQAAYIAVGVFHHYLITGDLDFVRRIWPVVTRALDYAISLQAPGGEIYWAKSPEGEIDKTALLTGSSSIFMSLKCGLSLARLLEDPRPAWAAALHRLGNTIRQRRHCFNITKSRFSMDWFYPILCGALTGDEARKRIDKYWKKFVVDGLGVRCVSDEPWVTIAETSELVLALAAMGHRRQARIVFSWIQDRCFEDGSCWCGFTFPDIILWPEEKMTWTNAVVLMAADALYHLTPASNLFSHEFWAKSNYLP